MQANIKGCFLEQIYLSKAISLEYHLCKVRLVSASSYHRIQHHTKFYLDHMKTLQKGRSEVSSFLTTPVTVNEWHGQSACYHIAKINSDTNQFINTQRHATITVLISSQLSIMYFPFSQNSNSKLLSHSSD